MNQIQAYREWSRGIQKVSLYSQGGSEGRAGHARPLEKPFQNEDDPRPPRVRVATTKS